MGIKEKALPLSAALYPFARAIPLTPNTITFLSLLAALVASYLIYAGEPGYGLILAALAFIMDGLDGLVARARKMETAFGAYFDGVTDRVIEFLILSSMAFLAWPNYGLALCSILFLMGFGTFLTSFSKAYADHRKALKGRELDGMRCIFERTERSILILSVLLVYIYAPVYAMYLLTLGAVLSVIAFLQRFLYVFKNSIGKR